MAKGVKPLARTCASFSWDFHVKRASSSLPFSPNRQQYLENFFHLFSLVYLTCVTWRQVLLQTQSSPPSNLLSYSCIPWLGEREWGRERLPLNLMGRRIKEPRERAWPTRFPSVTIIISILIFFCSWRWISLSFFFVILKCILLCWEKFFLPIAHKSFNARHLKRSEMHFPCVKKFKVKKNKKIKQEKETQKPLGAIQRIYSLFSHIILAGSFELRKKQWRKIYTLVELLANVHSLSFSLSKMPKCVFANRKIPDQPRLFDP